MKQFKIPNGWYADSCAPDSHGGFFVLLQMEGHGLPSVCRILQPDFSIGKVTLSDSFNTDDGDHPRERGSSSVAFSLVRNPRQRKDPKIYLQAGREVYDVDTDGEKTRIIFRYPTMMRSWRGRELTRVGGFIGARYDTQWTPLDTYQNQYASTDRYLVSAGDAIWDFGSCAIGRNVMVSYLTSNKLKGFSDKMVFIHTRGGAMRVMKLSSPVISVHINPSTETTTFLTCCEKGIYEIDFDL